MVNVDTVYQTVLLILNQQQRGYMTPDEFNKAGTQAQLTIFEGYASDLNQQYRLSQNDTEYSNRIKNIEQKLQFFQRTATPTIIGTTSSFNILDTTAPIDAPVVAGTTDTLYRLGSVFYKDQDLGQYVQPNELRQLLLSPLTQPTITFPIYTYENNIITLYPTTINSDITISYLAKPRNIKWDFTTDLTTGAYLYASGSSIQFDLDVTEQDELILRILAYAGLIIQDPTIISAASQAVAAQDANEKQ
jgi:hypothetical protein|tara:strand:+ start:1136 stop:1876 length:741 start_codon:yes stop_codon:yes gene_type:complete